MAINLQKGQKINLQKNNGSTLQNICVGVNWGAIEKKGWLGNVTREAVDLDASCVLYDTSRNLIDVVYFGSLRSKDGAILHSGDDLTGDMDGDDGLDNEIITLDFTRLNPAVNHVAFVLNSFRGHDFGTIPFASIRIYEGTPTRVNEVFATYDIVKGTGFAGHVSMVLGIFYKRNGEWKFNAVGEPTKDRKLEETIKTVAQNYL
ncbi:TerD family protein [Sphingobacterium spiritivorum]|uniref:Bacterial stress protein n=1 Tax=Sphingobacterium spiritivorum ATCC 33861 TaxID=525373 RepID=D7VNC7_SPHSI|nr:TerD family protein [Sphingobacterium spiritivorum]EFK57424.1 bacterial stress protein [Sphingobacterium spiritivorum ATCC 33861]QQT36506.1 tellurium resistance TerZ family protein [Sphingobacterium spiritivorum]WQD33258.1 TerD family protein [Sphingobacterium spiritivorum]SUJ21403.1 Stress response protein SCP2 [Sphingobacterium spiritivorum]